MMILLIALLVLVVVMILAIGALGLRATYTTYRSGWFHNSHFDIRTRRWNTYNKNTGKWSTSALMQIIGDHPHNSSQGTRLRTTD